MSPLLENESSQVPVTALASAWTDLIFAGQGPYLKIYATASTELLLSERIFARQAIHGFAHVSHHVNSTFSLLIWGGRNICYCEVTREDTTKSRQRTRLSVNCKNVIRASDWIFDVSFQPSLSEHFEPTIAAVLVTAHNELLQLKIHDERGTRDSGNICLKLETLFSGPRCGLYSATLSWISSGRLLIASGTAFGEIVLWSLDNDGSSIEARRHYIFTGHEGSIFGVQISDEITLDDGTALRTLASCSDDRTIRVWNISNLDAGVRLENNDQKELERDASRTTGFLNYVSEEAAAASKDLCIASGMGHLSRIWDVRFVIERTVSLPREYVYTIVSVGEDATCQKWYLTRNSNKPRSFALEQIASEDYHEGKNIWSLVTCGSLLSPSLVTGGSDGRIIQHTSLFGSETSSDQHIRLSEWDIEDAFDTSSTQNVAAVPDGSASGINEIQPTKPKKGKAKQDSVRSFSCIGDDQILLVTNEGSVLLAAYAETDQWMWKCIASFDDLKGYSVSCRLTAEPFEYVFFGDGHGNIYYYHSFFEELKVLTRIKGKITKLMAEIFPSRTHEYMSIVVTRQGGMPPIQLRVNLGFGGNLHLSATKEFARWQEELQTITSCVIATYDSSETGLIIGCRNGSIYSYSQPASSRKREFDFELPLSHGKEAVTAMVWMPRNDHLDNMWNPTFGWLFSVGRDGTLAIHHFKGYYKEPILIHRLSLSFGPNLEGLSIDPQSLDVLVWGFTSKFFICQNVSAMEDLVTIECGGAHRIWTFGPFAASSGIFAWVKTMKLNIAKVNGGSHKVIQGGGHGREIKACAVARTSIVVGLGPLIATGAEDTNIAISYYADWHGPQKELKQLSVLRKHVTGIQALHWSSDGHFLFSCGGFEEFYVWHFRALPSLTVGVVCESKCPLDNANSELRITDFAVRDVSGLKRGSLGDEQWVFLISIVYSDSSIKVWKYTSTTSVVPDRESWSFIAGTQYTTACLTSAEYLSANSTGWPLVTGATDGHLAFWSLTDTTRKLACNRVQSLHQSSIKSLATLELTESLWLILSGGDDNALGCTLISLDDELLEYTSSSLLIPSAHAAAITAVSVIGARAYIRAAKERAFHIITASNDQMLKVWKLEIDLRRTGVKGISICRMGEFTSAVADISSLSVFETVHGTEDVKGTKVLICGAGIETWAYRG